MKQLENFNRRAVSPATRIKWGRRLVGLLDTHPRDIYDGWHDDVRALIEKGADLEQRDNDGDTCLSMALFNWQCRDFVLLMIEKGADVNAPGREGQPPLLRAISHATDEITLALIFAGADIKARCAFYEKGALHSAVFHCSTDVVHTLLTLGADVNDSARDGNTALMSAAWHGKTETAALLLDHGAAIAVRDEDGKTAYDHAREQGNTDICALIDNAEASRKEKRLQNFQRCPAKIAPLPRIKLKRGKGV